MQTVTRGADGQENAGFTGRYRLGPERAAIRLVIFSDYQCVDCRRIEAEARRIVESRSDASLSAKHFPMCGDCNPHMPHNMHPNACWAARAAEAAGMLAGAEGFWRMDRWLFERGGAFTDAELGAALPALGFNAGAFIQTMTGEETLRRVRADIEEAVALGLHFTPMIFINGVELRGWNAPDALARAVDAVVAADPPIRTAAADRPAPALEKYVDDWRAQPVRRMNDSIDWSIGAEGPAIQIVLFGDYTHDLSAQADELLRAMIRAAPALPDAAGGDVSSGNVPAAPRIRYHFRHFPFDARCNPMARQPSAQPFACRAAAAAEAAGRLAGPDGYWRMHEMLMQNHANLNSDDVLRNLAAAAELDPVALFDLIDSAEIDAAIAEDVRDAQRLGVQGIPTLFVNGRLVPRWRREGDDVLPRILAAAEPE
jgi:protein-disulfide isomerase